MKKVENSIPKPPREPQVLNKPTVQCSLVIWKHRPSNFENEYLLLTERYRISDLCVVEHFKGDSVEKFPIYTL